MGKQKKQKNKPGKAKLTFDDFAAQYLEWAKKTQPERTYKANRLAVRKLSEFCRGVKLKKINSFHLDQVIADGRERGLKATSINCYVRHAKTLFAQAVRWGLIKKNPFASCRQLRIAKQPPKALDEQDIKALFDAIDDRYVEHMITAYLVTGRSRSELTLLRWEDIDFEQGRYYITRTKTHLSKWYPIGRAFKETLKSFGIKKSGLVFYRQYHPDTISHKVRECMQLAGLDGHCLHHLRHSFARLYLEGGGSIFALQQLLGHSQVQTTQIYSSMGVGALAEEIERVSVCLQSI